MSYRVAAPPSTIELRDPFPARRRLLIVGIVVIGGVLAGTALDHARGLRLQCSRARGVCALTENYGGLSRIRRFALQRTAFLMSGAPDTTTLVLGDTNDRFVEVPYTRPMRRAAAERVLASQGPWPRDPAALDLDVRADERPRWALVVLGWIVGFVTLLFAAVAATATRLEIRPSEKRVVVLWRGPATLYRSVEVDSLDFGQITSVSVTRSGRGPIPDCRVLARTSSGQVRALSGWGARAIAERHVASLVTALKEVGVTVAEDPRRE